MLEIENLFDQDSFYFKDGLKDWAKVELERRGVQTLDAAISAIESLTDYSAHSKRKKPNSGKNEGDKSGQKKDQSRRDGRL